MCLIGLIKKRSALLFVIIGIIMSSVSCDNERTTLSLQDKFELVMSPVRSEKSKENIVYKNRLQETQINNIVQIDILKKNQNFSEYDLQPKQKNKRSLNFAASGIESENKVKLNESDNHFENDNEDELQDSNSKSELRNNLLLHRSKRYLTFPDGSSFQLVFDLIIPIVDYTNYLIMGITCAVAWELPSKPPSEILQNFREKLNEGTFGLTRRNDTIKNNLRFVDNNEDTNKILLNSFKNFDSNNQHTFLKKYKDELSHYEKNPNLKYSLNHMKSSKIQNNQFKSKNYSKYYNKFNQDKGQYLNSRDNWWKRNKHRVQQHWVEKQKLWGLKKIKTPDKIFEGTRFDDDTIQHSRRIRRIIEMPPKHYIHSVYGRERKHRSELNLFEQKLGEVHLREHLQTRQKLFQKIEKLYQTRGINGTACVQRALCETGQFNRRPYTFRGPFGFITELLRAIFVLPQNVLQSNEKFHIAHFYMKAHLKEYNCEQQFSDCTHSLLKDFE